uniref:polynucleotide adenylyltransferase n=1 Tax=Globodera rostochiensis TaxID=31243 RepID=A0A914HZN3_GLORO
MPTSFKARAPIFDELNLGKLRAQKTANKIPAKNHRPNCPSVNIVIISLFVTAPIILFAVMIILLIAFFNSILFQLFFCKSPSKLTFGINYQNLDAEYCRLFFDANLDDSDQMEHSARLGAVLIKNEIDLDLVNIDVIINQIFLRKKKVLAVPPSIDKSILNAKFKKIKAKIEKKKVGEKFSLVEICKLRIFGMEMKEIRDFLLKVGHKFEEKDLAHLTKLYEKGSNSVECKQLEKVDDFFEKNESEMQIWMFELRNFISQLHSLKLDYLFSNSDDAQKKNFSIWRKFSVRIDGESELSHKLRMLNGRGEIDQIVRIKQKMNRYLMEYKYIGMLELHNPLTMAFDIMGDKMLKTTFRTIVVPADGHQMAAADEITLHNKIWLQISLLCGKIIDYFVQQIHNAKVESANNEVKTDKIENYWKLFARLLGLFKKNSEFDDQKLLLNKFVTLLDYLKGQFGEHKMNLKRKLVLDRLENCFLELYDEDAEFREFLTNDNLPSMALLKEIFEIAKEKDELISEQFWFFITNNLLEYKESNKSSKEKAQMLEDDVTETLQNRIVLLPDETEFRWSESDCSNANVHEKVIKALLKNKLTLAQFHFVALNTLLRRFNEIRHFFCYGMDQINNILLKDRIQLALGDKVLDALELAHPELMHFELLTFSHNYLLFLRQLSHKTGSLKWHIITECQQEGIVKAAIAEQRRRIRKKTLEFLWKSSAKTSLRMIDPIRAIPGGMTRLWKTLYDSEKTAEQNDDDISALRHLMDSSKMMPDYEDVGLLISHYEEALLSDHDKDRIQGKMKAEFLIFFNWINDHSTISFPIMKKIRKYFSKHFQMLNEFYDQIFDESEAEVEQNEHYLVDLIFETKNDVERIMAGQSPNGGTETESAEEWRKRNFHRIIGGKRGQSLEKAKHWEDYLPWMRELHGLTLPNLIKTNEHFAQKLKTACESSLSETNKENENMHYEEEIGERKEIIGAESTSKSVETKAHSKKLDPKEFAGIKLGDFANDNFLALKYGELMAIILREGGHTTEVNSSRMSAFPKLEKAGDENSENYQNCNTGDGADSLARLLDIGALANEIWHYVQTIKALNESKIDSASIASSQILDGPLSQQRILGKFGQNSTKNYFKKIDKYLIFNKKLNEQRNLDENLLEEYKNNSIIKLEKVSQIKNHLIANGYLSEDYKIKSQQVISELSNIVEKWSPEALIQFPRFLFEHKKLEPICILPDEFERELIFGKLNCDHSKRENCGDESLYCSLCLHSGVKLIKKVMISAAPPTLEITFMDVPIEMAFIMVPNVKVPNSGKTFGLKTYEKFAKIFEENIESLLRAAHFDEGMKAKAGLRTLSNCLINEKILEILSPVRNFDNKIDDQMEAEFNVTEKLRIVIAYLELWAKSNYIYGKVMGYLDTPMLLTMTAKVFLMFPKASIPFLIEKYFLIYSKWNWPMPVQLTQIDQKRIGEFMSWAPNRERQFESGKELAMAIISPLFPEQKEAMQINLSTAKIIQIELKMAFAQIRKVDNLQALLEPIMVNGRTFTEKYEHFVTFTCGGTELNVENFCHFVGKRLRHELLYFVENSLANWVRFCHVYPTCVPVELSDDQQTRPTTFNKMHKKVWLVGLKLRQQKKKNNDAFKNEFKSILGQLFYNVQLNSEYVEEKHQLPKWIQL